MMTGRGSISRVDHNVVNHVTTTSQRRKKRNVIVPIILCGVVALSSYNAYRLHYLSSIISDRSFLLLDDNIDIDAPASSSAQSSLSLHITKSNVSNSNNGRYSHHHHHEDIVEISTAPLARG